ncbi:transcription termination factor 3, mitochondrial [Episyrphus balteatus]|uniref:transcription termination factor 3, mitochondrial n=1 Tax=Episyrphus balteatus TaxID=286459 RepID=UPI002485C5E5|nr:transcription termination factor 3, mitochondrial [Episyrphus balteatus]
MLFLRIFRNISKLSNPQINLNFSQCRQLRKITRPIIKPEQYAVTTQKPIKSTEIQSESYTNHLEKVHEPEDQLPALPKAEKDYVPTFNLAAYVNKSECLQQLLKLGVNLNSIEKRKGLAEFVLKLDFEKNIKPHLMFLHDLGVPPKQFGELITKNPLIFKENLDDLQVRVNYLQAKKFNDHQITRIVTKNPYWLMFSTKRIDKRLGYFQENFKLSGDDVRFLAAKQPRLITYSMEHIRKNMFCITEEMGFELEELRCLLLNKPKLWMLNSDELIERFAYAHNEMKLSHEMIVQFPEILLSREFRIRERHEFLKTLGRAQYDPHKDLYVSPKTLVEGNDRDFVVNVAKCDMEMYEMFLKTR